jgi:hypothetical protein
VYSAGAEKERLVSRMRIPFPERVPPWAAGCFAGLLCFLELLQGTRPAFVVFVFLYIMLATMAFNMAGGLYRASGAYVFASAMLSLIVVLCAKVYYGEAADTNLIEPVTTIMVYTAGMGSILLAVILSRKFLPAAPLLGFSRPSSELRNTANGCIAAGILLPIISSFLDSAPGTLGSALNQFQLFIPLGIILAVYVEIHESRGRHFLNFMIVLASTFLIVNGGIIACSKQALFTPLACVAVTCGALRYRFRLWEVLILGVFTFVLFYYFVPYAQVVRNYTRDIPRYGDRAEASVYWLNHLEEVRTLNESSLESAANDERPHYFSSQFGFLERLGMISIDDALVSFTDNNGAFGYRPIFIAMDNLIPHFLWRNKPNFDFNNVYAHEVGILAEDDTSTSVSFGPSADAYHLGKWFGVLVVMPVVLTIMFFVADATTSDIKQSPWGLVFTVAFFHSAPEAMLGLCLDMSFFITITLLITFYFAHYFMPLFTLILFPERRQKVQVRGLFVVDKTAPPVTAKGKTVEI